MLLACVSQRRIRTSPVANESSGNCDEETTLYSRDSNEGMNRSEQHMGTRHTLMLPNPISAGATNRPMGTLVISPPMAEAFPHILDYAR